MPDSHSVQPYVSTHLTVSVFYVCVPQSADITNSRKQEVQFSLTLVRPSNIDRAANLYARLLLMALANYVAFMMT